MFILRKFSTDNDDECREYQGREAARNVMQAEYNAAKEQYEDTYICQDTATCADAESNRYIGWLIYETPVTFWRRRTSLLRQQKWDCRSTALNCWIPTCAANTLRRPAAYSAS